MLFILKIKDLFTSAFKFDYVNRDSPHNFFLHISYIFFMNQCIDLNISSWRSTNYSPLWKFKWIDNHTNTYIHEMSWKRKQNNSYITDQRLFTYMRQRCVYISISSSHIFLMHPLGKSVVVLVSRAKWVEPCGSTYGLKIKHEYQKVMKFFFIDISIPKL